MFPSSMSLTAKLTSAEALRGDAIRHTAAMRAASVAIAHAPTIDDCSAALQRAKEALEQLERTVSLHEELYGADLTLEIEHAAAALPLPDSWLDAVIAQLVLGLAERVELLRRAHSERPGAHSRRDVAEQTEHVEAARAALRELTERHLTTPLSSLVVRWLPVALATLDEAARHVFLEALRHDASDLGFRLDPAILAA